MEDSVEPGQHARQQTAPVHIHQSSASEIPNFAYAFCPSLKRIVIPSTVKMIGEVAFRGCSHLEYVELNDGLEHIGNDAFRDCILLTSIDLPSTIRVICDRAFRDCKKLERVEFHHRKGRLEKPRQQQQQQQQLGSQVFRNCIALERIHLPSSVKVIGEKLFNSCVKLSEVMLSEGLRRIGNAFCRCLSLKRVNIPSTVYSVHKRAFSKCPKLVAVKLNKDIEKLVCYPGQMQRDWWNEGVPKHALRTYCLLTECNLLNRLGRLRVTTWRNHIQTMLKNIPSIPSKQLETYVGSIVTKLAVYEQLQRVAPLLELCIWKSKLVAEGAAQHRINCGASIIIPNVLSFLLMDRLPRKSVL